jgi:hypothetical protein
MRDAQQQQMAAFSEGEIHTETSPFIQRWHLAKLDYY